MPTAQLLTPSRVLPSSPARKPDPWFVAGSVEIRASPVAIGSASLFSLRVHSDHRTYLRASPRNERIRVVT
ncbi:hypothetical protein CTA2_12136, partial [Colletotrichum tanaceti]